MSRFAALLVLVTIALAAPSHAACYVDYKAKRDNPLRLHYGVMQLPDPLDDDLVTLAEMLKTRGYSTGAVVAISGFPDIS